MATGDNSDQGRQLNISAAWLHLYGAALSGMCASSQDYEAYEDLAVRAAEIADAAVNLIKTRVEIIQKAKAVVEQPEPED